MIVDSAKPTKYGSYIGTVREGHVLLHVCTNSREKTPIVTFIKIRRGRFPKTELLATDRHSFTCLVTGSGTLAYFFDNSVDRYGIYPGDVVHIPSDCCFAFEGDSLDLIFFGEIALNQLRKVTID